MARESQSPERAVASLTRVTTAKIPPPTLNPELVTDLESEGTMAPNRDSTWPYPLKELEKGNTKTPPKSSPKPNPHPTPQAQALLKQNQQEKNKK